jgi:hypothetical protein
MLATMTPEFQIQFEKQDAYEIMKQLKEMFQVQARVEKYQALGNATQCKMQDGTPVGTHLLKMKGYFDHLERLGMKFDVELQTDLIMLSLPPSFGSFISHFHMSDMKRTIPQLFGMLRTFESDMKPRYVKSRTSEVLVVQGKSPNNGNKNKKRKAKGNKVAPKPVSKKAKDDKKCFHCLKEGHWKRDCEIFLRESKQKTASSDTPASGISVIDSYFFTSSSWVLDTGCRTHICNNMQGLRSRRSLIRGKVDLRVGNGARVAALAEGTYDLTLPNGLILVLNNCCYVPTLSRSIISVSRLIADGYELVIGTNDCFIRKNGIFFSNVLVENGLYVLDLENNKNEQSIYNVNTTQTNETYSWHCRLGHINEKRIARLQKDGVLDSFDLESIENCESCLMGKMTKTPFSKKGERSKDVLALIHSDVCGPMSVEARNGYRYFMTFTDDYSRYGYLYLMRHKSETFEKFKEFNMK